jgi:hypothetical protein
VFDLREAFAELGDVAGMPESPKQWLSKEEVLAEFPFTERLLKRLRDERRINTYNVNDKGEYCFKRSELDAYLESRCVPAAGMR